MDTKHLVWLASHDSESLMQKLCGRPDVTVLGEEWRMERLFAACDLVITKGNRVTAFEAASLGIPSISLSNGSNWPDDVSIAQLGTNVCLDARSVTSVQLLERIKEGISSGRRAEEGARWSGVAGAAEQINRVLEKIYPPAGD